MPPPLEVVIDARGIPSVPGNRSATILLLQDELEQTRAAHARIDVGGAQALSIVGGSLAAVSLALLVSTITVFRVGCGEEVDPQYPEESCESTRTPIFIAAALTGAGGATFLSFGLPPLFEGLRARSKLDRYSRAIRAELKQLEAHPPRAGHSAGARSVPLLRVHF